MRINITKEQIPNILTVSRVALIPVLVILLYIPFEIASWIALFLYIVICVTDYLDGYLARKWKVTSNIGTFLDPIADKILVAVLLIVFVDLERLPGFWILPVVIILMREFLISGLREFLGSKDVKVPVIFIAKLKTTIQMLALGFLIVGHTSNNLLFIGWAGILIAAAITGYTGYIYLCAAWDYLTEKEKSEDKALEDV